jgi:hypothetical protein
MSTKNIVRVSVILATIAVFAAPICAAPIITNVVETGGDNEATDTIPAKWTGSTFPVSVANEPVPGATIGQNYTVGTFGHSAPSFVDRNHRFFDDIAATYSLPVPAYLTGAEYIMSGNDNRDNAAYRLDVTVSAPVTAYMLIDNRMSASTDASDNLDPPTFDATHMQWIVNDGWTATNHGLNRTANTAVPDEVALDEGADGTINQWYSVYQKSFPAGTFSVFQADNAGQNMYGVVVAAIPEPATWVLMLGVGASLVTLRRRS